MSNSLKLWIGAAMIAVTGLACSREKEPDPGEPTPLERYNAEQRIRGNAPVKFDTASPVIRALTGDPDHDFLRAMSGHQKNVIVLADAALESNTSSDFEQVIRQIEDRHTHDLDSLTRISQSVFKDSFISPPSAEVRTAAAQLRNAGVDHHRIFLTQVARQESDARRIADSYIPRLRRSQIERLADRIKRDETAALAEVNRRLGTRQ